MTENLTHHHQQYPPLPPSQKARKTTPSMWTSPGRQDSELVGTAAGWDTSAATALDGSHHAPLVVAQDTSRPSASIVTAKMTPLRPPIDAITALAPTSESGIFSLERG